MTITLNGTTGITTPAISSDAGITADGISFADGTPANTLVTTTGGNVGIGTSSPNSKVDVSGSVNITNDSGLNGTWSGLTTRYISGNNATYLQSLALSSGTVTGGKDLSFDGSQLLFRTISGASFTERARIDSSGNLLVGCTAYPSATVAGTVISTALPIRTSTGTYTGAGDHIQFYNGNGSVGYIRTNGTATSYVTSSDYRLKENIQPMTEALSVVQQLNPVTYTWKADGSDGQGFIAHELEAVVPQCVTGEKDAVDADGNPVYQGIDTSFLVATLTAAIQEQQALITQLQADVAALKGQA